MFSVGTKQNSDKEILDPASPTLAEVKNLTKKKTIKWTAICIYIGTEKYKYNWSVGDFL